MKRVLCWILVLLMVVGCIPANAMEVYAVQIEPRYAVSEEIMVADPDFLDSEELLEGYIYQLFYGNAVTYRRKAGDLLTGNEKIVYDAVVPIIKQIASGERSSTVIGIGQTVDTAQGLLQADVEVSFVSRELDINRLYDALLTDLPYELYWHDKTSPTHFNSSTTWVNETSLLDHIQIKFPVSGNYRGSEEYSVDFQLARAAVAAAANSAAIVSKYADCTDYEKLLSYKNEICILVKYDEAAALGGYFSTDNDPWQLIHVFDGDDTTNVVCEGYAKAFAYLCEQTDFAGDVSCITVSGQFVSSTMVGAHMWNIVTLEGNNYLVDVTNSDDISVGYDGSLFLTGGVGSIAEGYEVAECFYEYWNDDTVALWGDGPDSILNLAPDNYVPPAAQVVASGYCNEQIQWSLDTTGTLTLTGTGDVPDYPLYGAPWYEEYKERVKKVVVEEDIRFIGDYVFAALPNLTCVILSGSVVCIGVGIFRNCTSLSDVWLPASLSTIKEYAFAGCTALERIELPMLVLGIGDFAFYGCTALRKINIPFQVHDIGATTFDRCNSLEVIRLPDDSRYYSTGAGGALYDINQQTLYKVPGGAITGHYVIPDSVTDIGASAFSDCSGLTAVTIPGSVIAIGENAFGRCAGLTDVYYVGTYEQWQQISISQGNKPLLDGQLHLVGCQNHLTVQYPAQAPSCTEPGWNDYEVCSVCGHSNYQEIPATGHTLFPYAGKEPTCTEYGWDPYGICETCGYSSYQEIPALGHSFVEYEAKMPGCTEYGWNAYGICKVCDYSTYVELPALGHRYDDIICTVCGGEAEILASGSCGSQALWEMRDGGILLIFGTGDMADYDGQYATPWADYTSGVKVVLIREGVTSIGESAFSGCQVLTEVDFANTVSRIGDYAFCNCDALTDIVIGENVTEIGYHAFDHCDSLQTVTIGSGVAKIRDTAFDRCPKLLEYRVSSNNESYSSDERGVLFNKDKTILLQMPCGISGSYAIPSGVASIDDGAFSGCERLTDVTVPETLTALLASTFEDCSSLQYNLHNDLQYLGSTDNPYYILIKPCTETVAQLQIHPDTKMIADEAFYDCQSLTSVTIPGSVASIGRHAFGNCTGLTALAIENGIQVIGDYAFSGCSALTALVIPDSVTTIGKNAFGACTGLTSVKMGKGVKTIGEYAFILCTGLSNFTIGEGVSTIGKYAFYYCTGLGAVTIPTSVMEIGGSAFESCSNLRDLYYWGSVQQWAQVDIKTNNNWINTVNLHFNAGHTHDFKELTCTICGYNAVDLTITNVTLRPDCAGLYYTGSFEVDESVKVARQGIVVSVLSDLPVADGSDAYSLWTEDSTSVLVFNILNKVYPDLSNADRAQTPIYARAYVELEDGTYIYSDIVSRNLHQVVEAADAKWTSLDDTQKTEFSAMYTKYQTVMDTWDIPHLKQSER